MKKNLFFIILICSVIFPSGCSLFSDAPDTNVTVNLLHNQKNIDPARLALVVSGLETDLKQIAIVNKVLTIKSKTFTQIIVYPKEGEDIYLLQEEVRRIVYDSIPSTIQVQGINITKTDAVPENTEQTTYSIPRGYGN